MRCYSVSAMVRICQGVFEGKSSAKRHPPAASNRPRSPLQARLPAPPRRFLVRGPWSRSPWSVVNEAALGWLWGGLRVACGWLWGRIEVALGWLVGGFGVAIGWLSTGFGVALGWLWVALGGLTPPAADYRKRGHSRPDYSSAPENPRGGGLFNPLFSICYTRCLGHNLRASVPPSGKPFAKYGKRPACQHSLMFSNSPSRTSRTVVYRGSSAAPIGEGPLRLSGQTVARVFE